MEDNHKVGAVLGESVSGFRYTYHFGDNWRHTVTIEDRLLPDESFNTWTVCIAGQNAGPPEDVGGGYAEFLEAISDPSHDEHAAMWQWRSGPFDPTGLDVNATNAALRSCADACPHAPGRPQSGLDANTAQSTIRD